MDRPFKWRVGQRPMFFTAEMNEELPGVIVVVNPDEIAVGEEVAADVGSREGILEVGRNGCKCPEDETGV
jgi:hypothetical protein